MAALKVVAALVGVAASTIAALVLAVLMAAPDHATWMGQ
jgi:hypothetical protein